MSTMGLDVFDRSAQTTRIWLNEITDKIGPDRKLAWHVLSTAQQPLALRSQDEFVQRIQDSPGDVRPVDPAVAARAVFAVLQHHVDPGEIAQVRHALPEGIRALWPPQKVADDSF
ncbi:DUF2267 domain-containing protein [Bosea sp. RCC_152_1]|uniref:DUF2267 domain-containing protein n=1 Tax=Bosea sp. RCC_152_1 TaxID=3239228 RepID=UPI0035260378